MPTHALEVAPGPAYPGFFIAFEGGEGAGKSTQSELLVRHLQDRGYVALRTREPGGTPVAEAVRTILLDVAHVGMSERAEALLFAAARADHADRVIRPALMGGAVVVTDRYLDSSAAYQGAGRGLGLDPIVTLSRWATSSLLPDLTVVLDLDPAAGLARISNPDRLEREPVGWHRTVRQGFLDLAAADPSRYLILDATAPVAELAGVIAARVDVALDGRPGVARTAGPGAP